MRLGALAAAALVAAGLTLPASCEEGSGGAGGEADATRPYITVYFYAGARLVPEYAELPAGDPAEAIVALLARGSATGRTNALPDASEVVQAGESGSGFLVEMNAAFWDAPNSRVRRAAAQIAFSLASIEDGGEVTLLDGLLPGEVPGRGGRGATPPLSPEDFADLAPWLEIVHPVAGELVSDPIPLTVRTIDGRPWDARLYAGGREIARARAGSIEYGGGGGPATVRVAVRAAGREIAVDVPVRLARGT